MPQELLGPRPPEVHDFEEADFDGPPRAHGTSSSGEQPLGRIRTSSEIELGPPSVGASPIASASAPPFLAPEGGAGFGKLPPLAENGSLHGGSGYSPRAQEGPRVKPLSLLPLIALIFYDVSGGPFGVEIAVSKGAPLLALLGFIILPIVWSVPEALITAELATTFPENSGFVAWVTAAFCPFWGFQKGFWSWLSGVTDNAVYPVMFLSYFQKEVPILEAGLPRLLVLVALNLALTYLNYRGLHIVGNVAVAMTVFTLLPFAAMTAVGLPHIRPANWLQVDWGAVNWVKFLNIMFWNLNYWDSVSTLAGEVQDPSRTFPRALGGALVLVVFSYLIPLLVGLGVTTDPNDWKLGGFTLVGEIVGGKWLGWWVVAAAAVSQVGQFEAEMSTDSFQLQGMAERGFLPAVFNRRSKYGTPTLGILCSSLGVMTMASFNFMQIVQLLNCVYCLGELLEFAAFIWLRIKYPQLHRPYRIPLPTWACGALLLPAGGLLTLLLLAPVVERDWGVVLFTAVCGLTGFAVHPLLQLARRREWCAFDGGTVHEFKERLYTMFAPRPAGDTRDSEACSEAQPMLPGAR